MDILITAIVIISIFVGLRFLLQRRAQRSKGKKNDLSIFDDKIKTLLKSEKSLLYFFTPTCGACKSQTPIIDDTISTVLLFPASFTELLIKQSLKPNTSAKRGTIIKLIRNKKTVNQPRHISNYLSLTQHLI